MFNLNSLVLPHFHKVSRGIGVALLGVLLLVVPIAYAASYTYDNTSTSTYANITCAPLRIMTVPDSFIISDLNLGLNIDTITTKNRGVLSVTLQSPAGTLVKVIQESGDSREDYSVLLDDSAPAIPALSSGSNDTILVTPPYFSRSARPSNLLSLFNGENAKGDWNILACGAINDAGSGGDVVRSSLQFTSVSAVGGTAEYVAVDTAKGYAGWLLVGASSLALVMGVVGGLWAWRQG